MLNCGLTKVWPLGIVYVESVISNKVGVDALCKRLVGLSMHSHSMDLCTDLHTYCPHINPIDW